METWPAILMLSGGKDSCSLAFALVEQGISPLCVTVDNGFLSDVARENIRKTVDALDLDHAYWKPCKSVFEPIEKMVDAGDSDMGAVCGKCSQMVRQYAVIAAAGLGIKKVYAGFTKYTAEAAGWSPALVKMVGDVEVINPYYESYDLPAIKALMDKHGLVFDPVKTNCRLIERIIKTTNKLNGGNHLQQEVEALKADGQLTDDEYAYYKEFTGRV
jgi:hypothetical protein